jgi:hypothetical protein
MCQQRLAGQCQPKGAHCTPVIFCFFCVKLPEQANQIWDDIGFGGKKGSIWSSPAALKNMAVVTDGPLYFVQSKSIRPDLFFFLLQARHSNLKISRRRHSWHPTGT